MLSGRDCYKLRNLKFGVLRHKAQLRKHSICRLLCFNNPALAKHKNNPLFKLESGDQTNDYSFYFVRLNREFRTLPLRLFGRCLFEWIPLNKGAWEGS